MTNETHLPAISVHIVTYNSGATLHQCLDHLAAQDFSDYRVQVFDNNSTDDTLEILRATNTPFTAGSTNLGYAAAHNRLIDMTSSTYVLTLNPDVFLAPQFLSAMFHALAADSMIGSAAGLLRRVERAGDSPTLIDSAGLTMSRSRRQRLLDETTPLSHFPATTRPIFGPDGAAAFYRRAMLEDICLMGEVFDTDFFMHKEDVDVCWRAQLRGWTSVYVPDAVADHIRSFRPRQRDRVSAYMRFLGVRNRYLLMIKNEIPAHFLRDLPSILFYDVGVLAYLLIRERASFKAFTSLWSLRRKMLEKRRMIQSEKRVGWRDLVRWFPA